MSASEDSARIPPEVNIPMLETKDLPKTSVTWKSVHLPIDILLLTVKECEFLSCLSYLNPGFCRSYHKSLGPVYFGDVGHDETTKLKIAVIQCAPGSTATKGSAVVVSKAVQILGPKAVFCVGFCGGLNNKKVKLGDVVISSKLITYAPSKVTDNDVLERGVRVPPKTYLADLIKTAGHGWEAPLKDPRNLSLKVHRDGVFLSGPEVVDSKKRRDQLIKRFPDAIAIEMEGEGLYVAAHDLDVEWVVIKGVSDFADGKKSETDSWRPFASTMAASLTAHILSDAIVFEDWAHYGNCNTDEAIAVTMLLDKAGKAWGTVNDLLHSSQGQHNQFKGKSEAGDILLHEEQRRPGFKMAGRVEHVFQYSGDKVITAVVARDNWGDDTGGEPEIISGGPGEKHVKVKVTSQYMRGFNHTVYVYGKK